MPTSDKLVTKTVFLTIDGNNFALYARQVTVNMGFGDVDISTLSDPANRHAKGTGDHQATIEFIHAKALSSTLTVLLPLLKQDDPVAVVYRPKNEAKGADNHEFTFDWLLHQMPFGGNRGDANTSSLTCPIDGQISIDDGTTVHTF